MKRINSKLILPLIFGFALLFNTSLIAQTGNVAGVVTDATDGSPLLGANIIISGTSIGTTTDRDGKYRLVRLNEGRTLILFMYLGYETDSVWVNVIGNKTTSVDVNLNPDLSLEILLCYNKRPTKKIGTRPKSFKPISSFHC